MDPSADIASATDPLDGQEVEGRTLNCDHQHCCEGTTTKSRGGENGQRLDERRAMEHGQASAGEVGLREGRSVSAPIRVGRATNIFQ